MKPLKFTILACASVVLVVAVGVVLSAETNHKETMITGEVVDLWCYLEAGARGPEHKECAITCVKAGQPIGIVDEKGHVYLALGGTDKLKPVKDMLLDKMAQTVMVTGHVVKKGGIEAIFIDNVKEIPKEIPKELPKELPKEMPKAP